MTVDTSIVAMLSTAIVSLVGAIGWGARWLTAQVERMDRARAESDARFAAALHAQSDACRDELREITAAFRDERKLDRESRQAMAAEFRATLIADRGHARAGAQEA